MEKNNYSFYAATEVVEMRRDPEMADVSNPHGAIYGFQSYVVAEDEAGSRKAKAVKLDMSEAIAIEKADQVAQGLSARLSNLHKMPVDFDTWVDFGARYGSAAHNEEDLMDEEELASSRRPRLGR